MEDDSLRKIGVEEFVRRLATIDETPDKRFAFFLGAGCSVSSGIPTSSDLVLKDWIPRLCNLCAPGEKDVLEWARKNIAYFNSNDPTASYGPIMDKLFLHAEERQREIERLCEKKLPGFGYAVLSTLSEKNFGIFNVFLTTNFDDLIADAFFLFTKVHPLVIGHESLASFIRPTRTRPLVVKPHGDYRLAPQNTFNETIIIKESINKQVRSLIHDRGLIFIGYGGNDQGIRDMLEELPEQALPFGVYWISGKEPTGEIRPWLIRKNAIWVEKFDFDELMLFIKDVFELPHPDKYRFEEIIQNYYDKYEEITSPILLKPVISKEDKDLRDAVKKADESLTGAYSVYVNAKRLEKDDPERTNQVYIEGLKKHNNSIELCGNYAVFLKDIRKDYDRAEEYYQRALELDPDSANKLGNYAGFLLSKGDKKEGERYLLKAIENLDYSEYKDSDLAVELWFYAYAHWDTEEKRYRALKKLKSSLVKGIRSENWDFLENINQSKINHHPNLDLQIDLAKVINCEENIDILDKWKIWKNIKIDF